MENRKKPIVNPAYYCKSIRMCVHGVVWKRKRSSSHVNNCSYIFDIPHFSSRIFFLRYYISIHIPVNNSINYTSFDLIQFFLFWESISFGFFICSLELDMFPRILSPFNIIQNLCPLIFSCSFNFICFLFSFHFRFASHFYAQDVWNIL